MNRDEYELPIGELMDEFTNDESMVNQFQDWLNDRILDDQIAVKDLLCMQWALLARLRSIYTQAQMGVLLGIGDQLMSSAIRNGAFVDPNGGGTASLLLAEDAHELGLESGDRASAPDDISSLLEEEL